MHNDSSVKTPESHRHVTHSHSVYLLRNFTLIIVASIIVLSIIFATSSKDILTNNLIESEKQNNEAITQLLANAIWSDFHRFLKTTNKLTADEIRRHQKMLFLNDSIKSKIQGLGIIKVKIYNNKGLTIFSSEFNEIGDLNKTWPRFIKAMNGKITSQLSFQDNNFEKKEVLKNKDIISSYVPIPMGDDTTIQAVFEVYKDITKIINKTYKIQHDIFLSIASVLFLLFLILFVVIRKADRVIKEYNHMQEEESEKIRNIAFYDDLTGLPNRVLFLDRLKHSLPLASRNQKLVVLIFLDLDKFKQINDNLGHEAGDELLLKVSERLTECVRTGDTVSRLSGDEFTLIVESLQTIEPATTIAKKIIQSIAKPYIINTNEVYITCSLGLSVYPFNDDNAESLIKKADAAMFFSKSCGRNNFHYFSPEMLDHGSQRFALENDLNSALSNSEFSIYFQPKVSLSNLKIIGMEALLHWDHPEKGVIPSDLFLPLLEETGIIMDVGEWVLKESCIQAKKWIDEGKEPICVSVNISALQFNHPNFLDVITSILEETKLPPKYLELELSESCLMENIELITIIMVSLHEKGIKLTIDKFGTGYTSLSDICKLPIDTLKIDKTLIQNMMDDSGKRATVTAIISFAHGLRLNILAEGVQTLDQLTFIKAMHCTAAQGKLLSEPLLINDFTNLYKPDFDFHENMNIANV